MNNTRSTKKMIFGGAFVVLAVVFLLMIGNLWENVGAGEIAVIQNPVSGKLTVYKASGLRWQGLGKVTKYKKSFQYFFENTKSDGDNSIKVRFNDGGHAQLSGSIRVDLPMDDNSIISLHTKYGSQEAIERQLIKQVVDKSVYMTGPMMSSKESYAEKRNDLISYIEDQAINGVYKTVVVNVKQKDAIDTTLEKTVSVVQVKTDQGGVSLRQDVSPTAQFNIKLYGLAINSIDYDATVEKQISSQQEAIMQVQTAIANAKRAEQEKFTVEQQGQADAATAKWKQEVLKATAVTQAEQELAVQALSTKRAELYKQQQILEGEGDAAKKRLVMQANGALEQKLEAWTTSQKYMWDAFAKFPGNLVPLYQSGGGAGSANALEYMQIMSMKAMKDLNLDMTNKKE